MMVSSIGCARSLRMNECSHGPHFIEMNYIYIVHTRGTSSYKVVTFLGHVPRCSDRSTSSHVSFLFFSYLQLFGCHFSKEDHINFLKLYFYLFLELDVGGSTTSNDYDMIYLVWKKLTK